MRRLISGCTLWAVQANHRQPHPLHSLCLCQRPLEPALPETASYKQGNHGLLQVSIMSTQQLHCQIGSSKQLDLAWNWLQCQDVRQIYVWSAMEVIIKAGDQHRAVFQVAIHQMACVPHSVGNNPLAASNC